MRMITWILVLSGTVLLAWLLVIVIKGKPDDSKIAWSEAVCAQAGTALSLDQQISDQGLTTKFSNKSGDCNQISINQVETARKALQRSFTNLKNVGLPEPSRGRYIQLVRNLRQDGVREIDNIQFNPYTKGVATLDINLSSGLNAITLTYGQAQLVLADIAPGLSNPTRARLAGSFTELAINGPMTTIDGDGLDQSGAYELWLMRRFGSRFLIEALRECRKPCVWPVERDLALRHGGVNPQILKQSWLKTQANPQQQQKFINSR